MMIALFVSVAVLLVLFGGLLAAADASLTVLSRTDLVDMASSSRSRRSLLAISEDVGTHTNALNFMRVVSETTAAVLVSLSFAYAIEQAETAGHSPIEEMLMLTTHGLLHLLGFDHAEPQDEKEMFGLQRDILVGFSLAERRR